MKVLHIAAECFPAAKVGGLADVVGALPKYQCLSQVKAEVIIPKYHIHWILNQEYDTIYESHFWTPGETIYYRIEKLKNNELGFPLYVIEMPGKFDREGVYSDKYGFFNDGETRWVAFQRAILDWILTLEDRPDILHCHDHHAGMIPFFVQYAYQYESLSQIPTVFTIHNERYQGAFRWDKQYLLPSFDNWKSGLLDWDQVINPFASAVKCANKITTVSQSYLEELRYNSFGLEWLFGEMSYKSVGILNGIDAQVWNPSTDPMIASHLKKSKANFKKKNKEALSELIGVSENRPIASFIGRLVSDKGVDIMIEAIAAYIKNFGDIRFVILGTGDKHLEHSLWSLASHFPEHVSVALEYHEQKAHQIYAGSEYLIMPSRVEPCGLNQMYAMRYGTIPIVANVGGLKDSVKDFYIDCGTGIKLPHLNIHELFQGFRIAREIFDDKKTYEQLITNCMAQDFSWHHSVKQYIAIYDELVQ